MSSSVLPSSKYNVERSTRITGGENQFPAMVLFHDAPRERESDSPAALLGGESRLEDTRAEPRWDARPIVGHSDADAAVWERCRREADASSTAGEGIDRILREHFDGPLEQDGVAIHGRRATIVHDIDGEGVREGRHARTKVGRYPIDESRHVHRLALRLADDALGALRDAIGPL